MKKLLYTFLCLTIIFSSCEKEEDNNNSNNNISGSIIGVWKVEDGSTIVEEGYINSSGSEIITDTDISYTNTTGYWHIKDNNTILTYIYENNDLFIYDTTSYTKNGNTLNISYTNSCGGSFPYDLTITELNNTNLNFTIFGEVFYGTNNFTRTSGYINFSKSTLP